MHIAHICLCLQTHRPTQRQRQKSAIANALFHSMSEIILKFMKHIQLLLKTLYYNA